LKLHSAYLDAVEALDYDGVYFGPIDLFVWFAVRRFIPVEILKSNKSRNHLALLKQSLV